MNVQRIIVPVVLLLTVLVSAPASAVDPVNATTFGKVAIKGYDPVAYFEQGKAVKGSKKITLEHDGATWRFASEEHRAAFAAEPQRFAPQYGGYCAWAVSQGSTADIDPEAFTIMDHKLYLNYNEEIQAKWRQDAETLIAQADVNWPKLVSD